MTQVRGSFPELYTNLRKRKVTPLPIPRIGPALPARPAAAAKPARSPAKKKGR